MRIVTDNAFDLDPSLLNDLTVEVVPLTIEFNGKAYKGGIDIQSDEFYRMLRENDGVPTTSQPSPADFDAVYRRIAAEDPDIISIHISNTLSGTVNAARLGADMAKETGANVTVIDSLTTTGPQGWMIEAAARAAKAGWSREDALALIDSIRLASNIIFSPDTLKYLQHSGRASHVQSIAASILNIKPVLKMNSSDGVLESKGNVRTMKRAITRHVDVIAEDIPEGTPIRVQIEHADNAEYADLAREMLGKRFECEFMPSTSVTPLLGAHLGPGTIGIAYGRQEAYKAIP